jgi:TonB family protein
MSRGTMESQLMFTPLATPQSRWRSFLIGWGLQAQLMLAILLLNAMFPKHIQQAKKYMVTNLVTPFEPVTNEVQSANARLVVKTVPPHVTETPTGSKLVVPRQVRDIREPEPDVKAPEIRLMSKTADLPRLPNVPIAKVVATNTFATPTNVTATTTKLAAQVQTGGFGDPNGIPATGDGKHGVNIAAKGSPGLPTGAGFGNGLGATKGVAGIGIVGNGVQSSGFDKQYSAPTQKQTVIAINEPGSPVEIIEKPKPSYTEEGRRRGVEGEVRLEVQFTADGHVRVLRVLQGLGYGLDEQALHCAEHIRFKPATHGGQPIDSTAVVHIVFELAS